MQNIALEEAVEMHQLISVCYFLARSPGGGVTMSDLVGLAYAGIIIAGGLVGYFKAGSIMSLTAGLGFGSVAGLAAYFNNNPILLVVSSGLALIMGIRFMYSGKIMPAGIVAVLR
ncbi:unnamed protein product [Onchocerca flexuosa]|uniref:Transmembrane protein 14C n=1 Tax=Onchocerca flexuosa TaxID=387005 RepID=A0A183I3R1_9BILA|nr:unnamed protein product [Onchocerca flexuosa]